MALDPYDYDEKDRPNAFKSRKKTGKWCRGRVNQVCEFETFSPFQCHWSEYTSVHTGSRYARWKCGCVTRCVNCRRMKWGRYHMFCAYGHIKHRDRPTDPDIHINSW